MNNVGGIVINSSVGVDIVGLSTDEKLGKFVFGEVSSACIKPKS